MNGKERKKERKGRKKEKERVLNMYIYTYIYICMYTFLRLLYNGKHKKGGRPEKEIDANYSTVLRCFAIGPPNRSA